MFTPYTGGGVVVVVDTSGATAGLQLLLLLLLFLLLLLLLSLLIVPYLGPNGRSLPVELSVILGLISVHETDLPPLAIDQRSRIVTLQGHLGSMGVAVRCFFEEVIKAFRD